MRHVAAQQGFNTKKSRDVLLAEKGPQLHECRNLEVLSSLLRQIFAEKQGLAASTAHDAGKGKGAVKT